ncbi:MAG: hypothetical protein HPAVJP_1560 [Candidatus Hepatoplasma vulgare]|nr:MAG: hypothetical protein HPAVJP_1560 [Candidatus Hepatoplasma sp.]
MQKVNKRVLATVLLPFFLMIIVLPFTKNNLKIKNINEENNFQIISSYFDYETLKYISGEYAENDMTVLATTGVYNGDISQINSITFDYQIKSENDNDYHNVSFDVNKSLFKIENLNSITYFYVELPIYYDYLTDFIFLEYGINYFILNPTLTINNIDNTSISTTYEQDYNILPGVTISDNGDQSYPKIVGFSGSNSREVKVLFSDGDNFNFLNYSSYSLYHYAEYYDLYDTNNENLLVKDFSKLTPAGNAKKIENTNYEGLYEQSFKWSDEMKKPPLNYGYKVVNESLLFNLNNNYKTISYILFNLTNEKEKLITPNIYKKNILNITISSNGEFTNYDYLKFDIYLDKYNKNNTSSYKEFTKHIEIGFNWKMQVNVDDPYGGHKEIHTEYITYKAQEVSEINSSFLYTSGLYYQESDIKATTDHTLHYTYYLVLPNENDWIFANNETYGGIMTFNEFGIYFSNIMTYDSVDGYEYLFAKNSPNIVIDNVFINH